VHTIDRSQIRRIRLRPKDQAVMLDTATASREITRYGSVENRRALAQWLQQRLAIPSDPQGIEAGTAPRGWIARPEGTASHLTRMDARSRWIGASIGWLLTTFTAFTTVGAITSASPAGAAIAFALTAMLAAIAAWVTFGEHAWIVQPGRLTRRTRFLVWARERTFQSAHLTVAVTTDSDGDRHYTLQVTDARGTKTIDSEMNDDAGVEDMGRWLAARSGFPLSSR
jgi:hypothetical protein